MVNELSVEIDAGRKQAIRKARAAIAGGVGRLVLGSFLAAFAVLLGWGDEATMAAWTLAAGPFVLWFLLKGTKQIVVDGWVQLWINRH
ncbi:MAG: hypothetical protein H7A45_02805 [Verrucomicrobiales bacterium]|nr:hypothetical protein [Verrucomicrobiales bacterium]MCP5528604.1 hypothetical protein [Verrucomicrobiales bacterium]